MSKGERKGRVGLTLLVAALVFAIQLVTVVLALVVLLIMIRTGALEGFGENNSLLGSHPLLLIMGAVSLVVGAILSGLFSKMYLQPINRFLDQMNRLAAGDFKARIHFSGPISGHPTFREVEDSFNAAAAELEQTEMLRSDFINNFSHEFKTPIVSIAGFAKLLRHGELPPEQQQEYLAIIEAESLRLAQMATGVLDLTKIENQNILTNVRRYNVAEQIRSAVLLLEDKWEKKQLEFDFDMEECQICANEELLTHIWVNLLDNAIKFSPIGGCITICLQEEEEQVVAAVGNAGDPIPPESIGRIFHKFYQADESHASQGSGIGLSVVEKVVQLHGGSVGVESCEKKTVFTVRLPKFQK